MLAVNRDLVLSSPELLGDIKKEAKATLDLCKRCELLVQLRKYEDWGRFDWALMCSWANPVDEPFIKLMIALAKHGYHYGAVSMHRWWRRLKAVNQANLVSFFTFKTFPPPDGNRLWWETVYEHCCRTHEMFVKMAEVYRDDRMVEMQLRAMLGASQNADLKQAFTKWAKSNHPDKGGSVEKFVIIKAAYEEWQNASR